jgi:hypothetical protein
VALEFFWLLGTKRTAGGGLVSGTQRQQRGVRAMGLLGPRQPMRCFGLGLGMAFPEILQPKNGRHRESRTPGPNDRNRDGGSMGAMIRFSKMPTSRELAISVLVPRFLVIRSSTGGKTREGTHCWYGCNQRQC